MKKKKTRSQMGKSAGVKGREYERKIVQAICEVTGLVYGKDIRRRYRGEEGDDVMVLSRRALRVFPFSIESKDRKKWDVHRWWDQAKTNTPEGCMTALVMHRPNTSEELVLIDLSTFLKFVEMVVAELDG